MPITQQLSLYSDSNTRDVADVTSTFSDNLSLPIHRWFRYSAGFSALWARGLIKQQLSRGIRRVLDPFAGSGTVLLEGEASNVQATGVEAHPFVARVTQAKLVWREDPRLFLNFANDLLKRAATQLEQALQYPPLILKCYPTEILHRLDALHRAWRNVADGSSLSELAWLALASVLRECSPVGTAQWQYVLPNKAKSRPVDPFQAFRSKVQLMSYDMAHQQRSISGPPARLYIEDARNCTSVPDAWADLVITSPPYANNYDYADATRLEMSFFGEVQGWGDLQETVRKYLVRSCTQHVTGMDGELRDLIDDPLLSPIQEQIAAKCHALKVERENHGGKKAYHLMIASYFTDMARVWIALRRVTANAALVCFVVGDSAPYGIYIPVEKWLGELALAAGFTSYEFEETRRRNVKWKNRKHRVPLHEGRLWVKG